MCLHALPPLRLHPLAAATVKVTVTVTVTARPMQERGYVLGNLDATIIAQKPKLSPHKENIRNNLCKLLQAHPSVINIKVGGVGAGLCRRPRRWLCHTHSVCQPSATLEPVPSVCIPLVLQAKTHEKVDSIGEERSIACHAVVMLIRQ